MKNLDTPPGQPVPDVSRRKSQHLDICLNENVNGKRVTTGFEQYRFKHHALPDADLHAISLQTAFLNKSMRTPLLISSMTGGTAEAARINANLGKAAEQQGWAMGLGSLRALLENPGQADSYRVRRHAPSVLLFANLGAVQLNYGFGVEECARAVALVEADALVLHLNSLQEAFQPEGNTNFAGLLPKIEQIAAALPVPVGVKEVGWGIDGRLAASLRDAGISFIDVAGAGGTSWSEVEKHRGPAGIRRQAAEAFADWGIPTAQSLLEVRAACPDLPIAASGGMRSGVDAAKALALGAGLVGFGRNLLGASLDSEEAAVTLFRQLELELRIAMFGIGVRTIPELCATDRLYSVSPNR